MAAKAIDVIGLMPAAVFYGVGYVITRAYVTTTGLQASFWFTEAFYREAGARFLLEPFAVESRRFSPLRSLTPLIELDKVSSTK